MTRISALVVLAVASAALGGCGKRGPLEPPPGVAPPARTSAAADPQAIDPKAAPIVPATPSLLRSTAAKPEPPDFVARPAPLEPRPFVLDPLL